MKERKEKGRQRKVEKRGRKDEGKGGKGRKKEGEEGGGREKKGRRVCCHLSFAVIRRHDQGTLGKKVFIWSSQLWRVRVHGHDGGEHSSR